VTTPPTITFLPGGVYTLPDAAGLLGLPLERMRKWVSGVALGNASGRHRRFPAGNLGSRGKGRDRTFSFWTLIELFSISQLRAHGLSMRRLRADRAELAERFQTNHPFALEGLLTDGRRLLKELGDASLLELGTGGQTDFEAVIRPFCARLDFDSETRLASRFYPVGRKSSVIVDPHHAFGRPIIRGTSITTEALACLLRGGEKIDDIASDFRLEPTQVEEAWDFERRLAA
jgi:uncharacterized protein (DUF433 family)